jgi:hypothetical protein
MYFVFTLDSHDHYGPFDSYRDAYKWAWIKMGLPSFQIQFDDIGPKDDGLYDPRDSDAMGPMC